uniref:DUF4371 domain-containing protein n=1 Tax=Photinus pyralis TaxID=7054 RepID=A0A1Y1MVW0_PHOPY
MDLDKKMKFETNYWVKVLERVINVTLTLAENNVSFRGAHESLYDGDNNRGNFLNIIKLLAIYDPVLQELLSKDKNSVKYLSPTIQNEIIELLATEVKTKLIGQINESPFFSIIMDTTQDIAKVDQVSFVIRFVHLIKDADTVNIVHDAEDMVNQLLSFFEKNNLSVEKLRAQGYDGAANMSGIYNGLQAKILEKQPNALYVHCTAHNLNLVINDSIKISRELHNFYDTVECLYAFFAHSIKRWAMLMETFESKKHTMKRLCPTRWSSRYDSLHSMRFHYREILQVLTKLSLTSSKVTEQSEALALKKKLENFETVVIIVMEYKILSITKIVTNALQSKNQDIERASKLLKSAKEDISRIRENFSEIVNEAADSARSWGIQPHFKNSRLRRVKKQFDELSSDERLTNSQENFRVSVFNLTLDVIISQIENRFKGLNSIVERFKVLFPSVLKDHSAN